MFSALILVGTSQQSVPGPLWKNFTTERAVQLSAAVCVCAGIVFIADNISYNFMSVLLYKHIMTLHL